MINTTLFTSPSDVHTAIECLLHAENCADNALELIESGPMTPARSIAVRQWMDLGEAFCKRATELDHKEEIGNAE